MARTVIDRKLVSRTARNLLPARNAPYWCPITKGRAIGYRKGRNGGSWLARYRASNGARYQQVLGPADDSIDAATSAVLSFAEAQEAARAWFSEIDLNCGARTAVHTVSMALDDYLAGFTGKSLEKTRHTIERHIRPELGNEVVSKLTTARLVQFMTGLANQPSVYRANRRGERKQRPQGVDAARLRKASANRIFTVLRAALNCAFNHGLVADDTAWRRVKQFPKVDAPRIRYFSSAEMKELFDAAEPWFRSLLQAALLTGGRWSEVCSLLVRDVDLRAGVVLFSETKGGRPRYVHLTDEGLAFFRRQCAGKGLADRLFLNKHGRELGKSHQVRPMKDTCVRAGIEPAGFHILRHTYGSTLAMAGVPLAVIAEALGHADERVTRKHYAHLAPSYVRETVRAGLGNLGVYRADGLRLAV